MSVIDLQALIGRTATLPFEMAETLPATACADPDVTALEVEQYRVSAPDPSDPFAAR